MFDELRERVCTINLGLKKFGLVFQTWGNASAMDEDLARVCIKPSGIPYDMMEPQDMVIVDLEGNPIDGSLRPSVDLPSHLAIYKGFPKIGGIIHTHSHYATCFAQARREIPCLGTTHADYFYGSIPVVPQPDEQQVQDAYEHNTGQSIVNYLSEEKVLSCPAVLVAGHGPFVWGRTVEEAFENAIVLEELARMAFHTLMLTPEIPVLESYLMNKHFERKHGSNAYYGQSQI